MQISSSELYNKIKSNDNSYTKNYKKRVIEADTDVQDMQESMETFKSSVRKLKRYKSGVSSRSRVEQQLKKFTSAYNDLKKVSANVTDKKVQKEMEKIDDYLTDNKKLLKKVGIKKGTNDKYSFDSEVFEDVEDEDLDELLTGNDSFIQKLSRMVRSADEKIDDAEYVSSVRSFHSITKYSSDDLKIASYAMGFYYCTKLVQENNELLNKDTLNEDIKNQIVKALGEYVNTHNDLSTNTTGVQSSLIDNIKTLDNETDNREAIRKIGLDVNEGELEKIKDENGNYILNDDLIQSDDFKAGYSFLFGSKSDYSNKMKEYAKEIYTTVLKTDELGLQIDFYS